MACQKRIDWKECLIKRREIKYLKNPPFFFLKMEERECYERDSSEKRN